MIPRPILAVLGFTSSALALVGAGPASAASHEQIRLSTMGGTGDDAYYGIQAAVVFNDVENEFLVVWSGTDDQGGHVADEEEIFGRRLDGGSGQPFGAQFTITNFGPLGDPSFGASFPAIVFNEDLNEYFLAFRGNEDGEREIFGLRLDGASGQPLSSPAQVSDMGPAGSTDYRADRPAVAYNSDAAEYLVLWHGVDDQNGHTEDEEEIYAQRILAATGAEVGVNDILVSDMGPLGDPQYRARNPKAAYDPINARYLAAWDGSDDEDGQVAGEDEIFIQFLSGSTAQPLLADQVRISATGGLGDPALDARYPAVAYRPGEFFVAWLGESVDPVSVSDLIGQRINAEFGTEVGIDDSLLAEGPMHDSVGLAYDASGGRYSASVEKSFQSSSGPDTEIFYLPISLLAEPIGRPVQVSFLGVTDPGGAAQYSVLALNSATGEALIAWEGYQDGPGFDPDEYEIYSRFSPGSIFCDGFESGDTSAWSSTVQ